MSSEAKRYGEKQSRVRASRVTPEWIKSFGYSGELYDGGLGELGGAFEQLKNESRRCGERALQAEGSLSMRMLRWESSQHV